ncbi:MAG TPA: hypothetical protein VHV79_07485 [Mycobacteriales bacterium]|nr:hypothetical protein [Mycobacteriales bacterium]
MKTMPKPTPALVIGTLALIVALGGTAAATTVAGQKKINGSQIKANSISGKQVKESTLATVPKAKSASELGGLTPIAFRVVKPAGTNSFQLFSLKNEAVVTASCQASPTTPGVTIAPVGTASHDLQYTYFDPSGGGTYSFGPPSKGGGVNHLQANFNTTINAFTTSGPVRTARLVILSVDEGTTCAFDVGGETSIPLVR